MLTPEQVYCIELIRKGVPAKLIAFAGAGKTSTLEAAARLMPGRRGIYLAFNKLIAAEAAERFPRSVWCRTSHSLAFKQIIGRGYAEKKLGTTPQSRMFTNIDLPNMPMHRLTFRSAVAETIRNYCASWDDQITTFHVPRVTGLSDEAQAWLWRHAAEAAASVWLRMMDGRDDLPMGHDGYVKLWALSRPVIQQDYILLDEAQDTAQVLMGVIRAQRCQVVCVGDSHQAIYEWRGAKDALRILGGQEARLTQSFRFGANIAEAANRVLLAMGETHPLRGNWSPDILEAAGEHYDAVLCRSNAGVIETAVDTMDAENPRPVYVPGGTGEMRALVQDAQRLMERSPAYSMDLMGFETWREVQDFAGTTEGRHLKVFVSLVDQYRPARLLTILERIQNSPVPGCVTISTAHKGKGSQWTAVRIHDDFVAGERVSMAERRLFYVAITRARQRLCVSPALLSAYSQPMEDEADD